MKRPRINCGEEIKTGMSAKGATWNDASSSNTELALHARILSRINSKVELEVSSSEGSKLLELKSIKIKKTTELRNEINTLLSN